MLCTYEDQLSMNCTTVFTKMCIYYPFVSIVLFIGGGFWYNQIKISPIHLFLLVTGTMSNCLSKNICIYATICYSYSAAPITANILCTNSYFRPNAKEYYNLWSFLVEISDSMLKELHEPVSWNSLFFICVGIGIVLVKNLEFNTNCPKKFLEFVPSILPSVVTVYTCRSKIIVNPILG